VGGGLCSRLKYGVVLAVLQMKSLCFPCLEYAVTGTEKMQSKYSDSTPNFDFRLSVEFCSACILLAEIIKQFCKKTLQALSLS